MYFMLSLSVVMGQLSNHLSGVCFTGTDKHRDYYGGASIWYDYFDRDNLTPSVIERLIEEME